MSTSTPRLDAAYRPATPAAIRALQDTGVPLHLPATDGYTRLASTSNLTKAISPAALVEARDERDVSTTLRLAAAFGVKVAVQGTGHGATEAMTDAICVHTHALDEVTVDPSGWARVGAGVKWERLIEAAAPHGLAPLCGSSPDVGVVGYLTGGGLGPLARSHGLSSDYVRAFDVVTGDGEVRRVSATQHADLFWGLRGGKGTLGIVTAVELTLPRLPEIYGGSLWFDEPDVPAVVRTWAQWAKLLPTEGTTSLAVNRLPDRPFIPEPVRGKTTVCVRFVWTGDPAEGEELIRALRAVARPLIDAVMRMPYAAIGAVHADPVDPMPLHESTMLLEDFGLDAADRFLELVGPGVPSVQVMVELRQLGGRVRAGDDCAFAHREAGYSLFMAAIAMPETAALLEPDAERILGGLAPWARAGSLPNFTGTSGAAWAERVFTPAVARRLRELSTAYDPDAVLLSARGVRS